MTGSYDGSNDRGTWGPPGNAPAPQGQPYQPPYPPQQQWYGPPPGYGYPPQLVIAPSNGLGITGFVCGLLGVLGFWAPIFGLVTGVLGVAFSGYGLAWGKRHHASTGLAIAGLVLGILATLVGVLITVTFATGNYN